MAEKYNNQKNTNSNLKNYDKLFGKYFFSLSTLKYGYIKLKRIK